MSQPTSFFGPDGMNPKICGCRVLKYVIWDLRAAPPSVAGATLTRKRMIAFCHRFVTVKYREIDRCGRSPGDHDWPGLIGTALEDLQRDRLGQAEQFTGWHQRLDRNVGPGLLV
jgi:hypothetical protein